MMHYNPIEGAESSRVKSKVQSGPVRRERASELVEDRKDVRW